MAEYHKPRYDAVRANQLMHSIREAKRPHSEQEFGEAYNLLQDFGVDKAIQAVLKNQIAIIDPRFTLSLPTKKHGPSIIMRFDYEKEEVDIENNDEKENKILAENIYLSRGVKIEEKNGEIVVSYLKQSNRPKNYDDLTYSEKNVIDQNVEIGGWVREHFDLPPHIEPKDVLTRRIELATMVSDKYFEEHEQHPIDRRFVGFTFVEVEEGKYYIQIEKNFEKAA